MRHLFRYRTSVIKNPTGQNKKKSFALLVFYQSRTNQNSCFVDVSVSLVSMRCRIIMLTFLCINCIIWIRNVDATLEVSTTVTEIYCLLGWIAVQSDKSYHRFGETCCRLLQSRRLNWARNKLWKQGKGKLDHYFENRFKFSTWNRAENNFVFVIPKYLNFATYSKDLLVNVTILSYVLVGAGIA
jgi:hypothetical protein